MLHRLAKGTGYGSENGDIDSNTVPGSNTVTQSLQIKRASFFGPFADAFVAQALRTVGLVHETTGYFSHQIQVG